MPAIEQIVTRLILEGADQATKQLAKFGAEGQKALNTLDSAGKKGAAGITQVDKAISRASVSFVTAQGSMGKIGSALGGLGASFVTLGSAIGVAALAIGGIVAVAAPAAAGLFALAKGAADTTDKMRDASIAAGTAIEKFSGLAFAAEQSGTSAERLSLGLATINDAANDAIKAGERSSGVFKEMGINLVDSSGRIRDSSDVFIELAEKISRIQNPADRAAKAVAIFGRRAGPQLVQLLSEGRSGLQGLTKDAEKLGVVFTDAQAAVGDKFNDAVDRLGAALTGVKTAIGLAFAPSFTDMINNLADAVSATIPFMKELAESASSQLQVAFEAIAAVLDNTLVPAFKVAAASLHLFAEAINSIFGTSLSTADLTAFVGLIGTLGVALGIVTRVAGGFMTALRGIGFLIGSGLGIFLQFANVIRTVISALLVIVEVGGAVVAAFNPVTLAIGAVAIAIGALVGVLLTLNWDAITAGAAEAWASIVEIWNAGIAAIGNLWTSVLATASEAYAAIVSLATTMWEQIKSVWDTGVQTLTGVWSEVETAATTAWNNIVTAITSSVQTVTSAIQEIIDFMQRLINIAVDAYNAILKAAGAGGGSSGGGEGKAAGGLIRGPGSSTSDSIPAWLSSGEWVIRAAAVQKYGSQLFNALNSMRLPARAIRQLLGYAGGGAVGGLDLGSVLSGLRMPAPHFAEGGPVTVDRVAVDFKIGGESFQDLLAPREVADRLIRFAMSEQVRSGGRKPGWYR